jgi:hypothetical protein
MLFLSSVWWTLSSIFSLSSLLFSSSLSSLFFFSFPLFSDSSHSSADTVGTRGLREKSLSALLRPRGVGAVFSAERFRVGEVGFGSTSVRIPEAIINQCLLHRIKYNKIVQHSRIIETNNRLCTAENKNARIYSQSPVKQMKKQLTI